MAGPTVKNARPQSMHVIIYFYLDVSCASRIPWEFSLSILANNLLIRAPRGKTDYLYYFLKKFREIAQIA